MYVKPKRKKIKKNRNSNLVVLKSQIQQKGNNKENLIKVKGLKLMRKIKGEEANDDKILKNDYVLKDTFEQFTKILIIYICLLN